MRKRARTSGRTAAEREAALRAFVEEMGLQFESFGSTRMAGRILGQLLVADPPEQTAEELATSLGASRASISTSTRLLIQADMIERYVRPGSRRDLFRIRHGGMSAMMRERLRLVTAFCKVLARGLDALAGEPPERGARLREMHELYAWLEGEIPRALDRYDAERRQPRPPGPRRRRPRELP